MSENVSVVDVLISHLGMANLDVPMNEREEPFYYELSADDPEVWVCVNTDEPNELEPPASDAGAMPYDAGPFAMVVWHSGWLAYIGPGGERHAGPQSVEDEWVRLLVEAIKSDGGEVPEGVEVPA